MGTEIITLLTIAVFGIFSIPIVQNMDSIPTPTPTEMPSPTPTVTPTPEPSDTPIPNATSTTIPDDGVFEQHDGNSSVIIKKNNGSTSVNVTVEGNGSADVNVHSNSNSSSSSTYKSEYHIESSVNSN